ncbi:MAG TPA: ABC transporter ATP-binding protein [Anaerolineaceae bacterium]|nr:ABC transporter ATP-binding protein [Anaerolineaceae bacterium]
MSFSIGGITSGMGPRDALDRYGSANREDTAKFNPRVIRRLLAYLRPHGWKMAVAFVLTLGESGLTLLAPYLTKVAIDQYIEPGDMDGLWRIALVLTVAFVALFAVSAGQRYLLSWVGQNVLAKLREDLFRHLQRLHLGYHDRHIVGVTVSRVMNDVAEINELLSQGVITLIGDVIVLVGIIIIMLTMSPRLALLTFIVLPLVFLATWIFSHHARSAFRETRSKIAAVVGDLAEDISGMRAIQAFAQEKASQERFERVNLENREAYIKAMSLSFIFLPTIEILGMVATAIVLWFGGRYVIGGTVTIGVMVAFLSYVTRFFQPILEVSRLFTTFQSAMAGGEQVVRLLDTPLEITDALGAVEMPPAAGRVEFDHVVFRYNPDAPIVINDVSFVIQPGQTVALVGPTGAGKTSIANLVTRFYDIQSGSIRIDDMDIRGVTLDSLRRQVCVVSQEPFLFSRSIEENILYGKPDATREEVEEAARQANAHDFIMAYPDGYETRIQEGGVNLSVGQRQLISIARAILTKPRILILDEATANIDTVTEVYIQQALEHLLQGRTAIVIAHRLSTVRNADWIYVLDHGSIVEQGSHGDLIDRGGLYSQLYARQFSSSN